MPRIEGIALYQIVGEHDDIVAPDARSGILPPRVRDRVLVLMAEDGAQGVTTVPGTDSPATEADLGWLIDKEPRSLFAWENERVAGIAEPYSKVLGACPTVDVALLDLCAKEAQRPLWSLLGAKCRQDIPVYDSSAHFEDLVEPGAGVAAVAARARAAVDRGFRAVKVHVGRGYRWMPWPESTDRDVEACKAVRAAVGDSVDLILDASGGYAGYVEDAADLLAEVGDCRIAFAADVVDRSEIDALRRALGSRAIRVPLAAAPAASWIDVHNASADEVWPDIVETYPGRIGILGWLRLARQAAPRGCRMTCKAAGSFVALQLGLHLSAVTPHCIICEYPDVSYPATLRCEAMVADGSVHIPEAPGLGIHSIDPRSP
jgi:galactonate dehydratase